MRNHPWFKAERYRVTLEGSPYESKYGDRFGCFEVPSPGPRAELLRIIVSDGDYKAAELDEAYAWEHVSVSLLHRTPTWEEMCLVKSLFWSDDECVVQYHPPKADHINVHPFCLHLWRPLLKEMPMPPKGAIA